MDEGSDARGGEDGTADGGQDGGSDSRNRDRPVHLADGDELDSFVAGADVALVEFYTDGCGICASMDPVLGNVARESDAAVGLINPRDDPPLVEAYDVRSVPLLVLFEDGSPVARLADGFQGTEAVLSFLAAGSQ
jgi:thioredoxin 1